MTTNINEAINQVRNAVYGKDVRGAIADGLQIVYDNASQEGNTNMEVIMARGTHDTLGHRLNDEYNELNRKITSVGSGGPHGIFVKYDALVNTFPNGNDKIYLVTEDGNWYFYNGLNWIPGGLYQAAAIADQSITTPKLADGGVTPQKIAENSITYDRLKNPVTRILHPNTLIVDFKSGIVQTDRPDGLWIITDENAMAVHNNIMQTIDISQLPGIVDPNIHTVYRIYLDRDDNNKLKVAPVADKIPKNYTLGHFYKGQVYGNELGIKWIGADGKPRNRVNIERGTLTESTQRNVMRHIVGRNVIRLDFFNKKVDILGNVHILMDNSFTTVKPPGVPIPFPDDYVHGQSTYKLYYDIDEGIFKVVLNSLDTKDNPILCRMYYTFVSCESYHSFSAIGTTGKPYNLIEQIPIETEGIAKSFVDILHSDSIEINYQTKKAKVTNYNGLYIWRTNGYAKYVEKDVEFDFTHLNLTDNTIHVAHYLYIDRDDFNALKMGPANEAPDNSWVLAKIYQTNVQGNERGIRVIDVNGNRVNRVYGAASRWQLQAMDPLYAYTSNMVDILASEKKVRWKAGNTAFLSTNNGTVNLTVPEGQEYGEFDYSSDPNPISYVRVLYYDFDEKTLKVKLFSEYYMDKRQGFICMFQGSGASVKIITHFGNEERLMVDGLTYQNRNKGAFDWMNNKFILPKDLYLLKDVPYSINAHSFNYQELNDADNAKFELITPSQVLTFEDSATFQSPIDVKLQTRLVGAIDGKRENALFQNLNIHVADPTKVVNKDVNVLMIGDSITNASIPPYVAYWLRKFGMNPTMVGTLSNNYTGYGFGHDPAPTAEKGEGRGGWRLTDFVGTTKRKDGSTFISKSPFLNPASGYSFDFGYYMNNNGFTKIDFVIIMLGTNDLTGFHYQKDQENIGTPTQEEILAYMPYEYNKMITSIKAYNPNAIIGLVPPPLAGYGNTNGFNKKAKDFTEVMNYNFDGKIENVYCLANYLANGPISGKTSVDNEPVQIDPKNPTMRGQVSNNVHDVVMNTSLNALWSASFIINRSK